MRFEFGINAFNHEAGALVVCSVEEEYQWVAWHASRYFNIKNAFPFRQKLTIRSDRVYDTLFIELFDGCVREYWFDISHFYGN